MSLIISKSDQRFKNLEIIFNKYSRENTMHVNGSRILYFIPPELVLVPYESDAIGVYSDEIQDPMTTDDNWVSRFAISRLLNLCCNISDQEYFDLITLHINDTDDRPKCVQCGAEVPWGGRLSWGYNQSVYWEDVRFTYCSNSHAKLYQATHPDDYPKVAAEIQRWIDSGIEPEVNSRAAKTRFIQANKDNLECYLYITRTISGLIKFGITSDIGSRTSFSHMNDKYISPHLLYTGNAYVIAEIEYELKLEFNGSEYIHEHDLAKFFSLFRKIINRSKLN